MTEAPPHEQVADEQVRQEEGSEVVDLEGFLESVGCHGPLPEDRSRVVRQYVDAGAACGELGGERAHVVQAGEVGGEEVGSQLACCRTGLVRRAADDDHLVSVAHQSASR